MGQEDALVFTCLAVMIAASFAFGRLYEIAKQRRRACAEEKQKVEALPAEEARQRAALSGENAAKPQHFPTSPADQEEPPAWVGEEPPSAFGKTEELPWRREAQLGVIASYKWRDGRGEIMNARGERFAFKDEDLDDACPPMLGRFVDFLKIGDVVKVAYNEKLLYDRHVLVRGFPSPTKAVCPHCGFEMFPRILHREERIYGCVCGFCLAEYRTPRYFSFVERPLEEGRDGKPVFELVEHQNPHRNGCRRPVDSCC